MSLNLFAGFFDTFNSYPSRNLSLNWYGSPLQKTTTHPVSKNLRDAVLKVPLIDPEYFFPEKYIENAGIKRKILFI